MYNSPSQSRTAHFLLWKISHTKSHVRHRPYEITTLIRGIPSNNSPQTSEIVKRTAGWFGSKSSSSLLQPTNKKLNENVMFSHVFIAMINHKTRTNDCMIQVPKRLRSMARPKASSWATNLETPSGLQMWAYIIYKHLCWFLKCIYGFWTKVPVHY